MFYKIGPNKIGSQMKRVSTSKLVQLSTDFISDLD